MAVADLSEWLDDFTAPDFVWYVKRLTANDTSRKQSHQAGPYISKSFLFKIFPAIAVTDEKNPDQWFDLYVDSHADARSVRAVYYNNKFHDNPKSGRNETRLTNFGGETSALLDLESTGALTVFAFRLDQAGTAIDCHVWVCRDEIDEELVEDRIGPVEPGRVMILSPGQAAPAFADLAPQGPKSCWLQPADMPAGWITKFPTAAEIVRKSVELRQLPALTPDQRLVQRRDCEFEIFRSVEQAIELPNITAGFATVDDFITRAQTILQRRKSRAGRSLELHAREIFIEERLVENTDFSHQPESDPGKRPDFLFPSEAAYKDTGFPVERLRMLAVKTTTKDRWRQILNEASRIPEKHLLTLQEGVSEPQFKEMTDARVRLVVPKKLIESFPKSIRPHLQTLESFIGDVRLLGVET